MTTLYTDGTRVRFAGGDLLADVIGVPQRTLGTVDPSATIDDIWEGDLPAGMTLVRWDHTNQIVPAFTHELELVK